MSVGRELKSAQHAALLFVGARRGNGNNAAAWILVTVYVWKKFFLRSSHGGKVLKNMTKRVMHFRSKGERNKVIHCPL